MAARARERMSRTDAHARAERSDPNHRRRAEFGYHTPCVDAYGRNDARCEASFSNVAQAGSAAALFDGAWRDDVFAVAFGRACPPPFDGFGGTGGLCHTFAEDDIPLDANISITGRAYLDPITKARRGRRGRALCGWCRVAAACVVVGCARRVEQSRWRAAVKWSAFHSPSPRLPSVFSFALDARALAFFPRLVESRKLQTGPAFEGMLPPTVMVFEPLV